MNKIIDLRENKAADRTVVIAPDYRIQNNNITIDHMSKDDSFRVHVGCQSKLVTKDNVLDMLEEITLKEHEAVEKNFIVKKGVTPKGTCPIYKEKSASFIISTGGKTYPSTTHETKKKFVKPGAKHFKPQRWNAKKVSVKTGYSDYDLTDGDVTKVTSLLESLRDYWGLGN